MRILIVGSGGREHAIAWAISSKSKRPVELYCAPGNAGISRIAKCVSLGATKIEDLATFAQQESIDLTIVGGESSLAAGIVDEFESRGLKIAGPRSAAARLESSKVFAKQFMSRHGIPTADYNTATSVDEAIEHLRRPNSLAANGNVVIKADGLAGGKGVVVAQSVAEAEKAVRDMMTGHSVGDSAANSIVIEETLTGPEVSLLLFTDGKDYALMPPARDHKRIGENDTGPNTGGMGVVTSPDIIDPETLNQAIQKVVIPTLEGARSDGLEFKGILFVGLMLTPDGPKVLEYNVRFGDPETQAIMVRLESDPVDIFEAIASGGFSAVDVRWKEGASACVVLASDGYPVSPRVGDRIDGLETSFETDDTEIFHAGTGLSHDGGLITAGGRVLGVTSAAPTLAAALDNCYSRIRRISWMGMQYRRDIGRSAIASEARSE